MMLVLIWTVASMLGSLFHVGNAYEAWLDRAALRSRLRRGLRHSPEQDAALDSIATTNLRSQIASSVVQIIFFVVGTGAYLSVDARFLAYLLVVAQIILAINAFAERRARAQMFRQAGLK